MRLEHSTPSISLLLTGALLALGACGDDGSGTPETTTGEDSTTTAMPTTTTDASADTTMGPADDTTTDDPTAGATTTTTDPTETDSDTETSMGGPVSFRFNSIELTDPGIFFVSCGGTDLVNGALAGPIANDEDGDGFIDMSFVLDFPDLVQTEGATGAVTFANAQCEAPEGDSCGLLPDSELYPATYTIMTEGTCLEATAGNIEPGTGSTGTTMGPCFVTDNIDATVATSAVVLPLSDVRVAAQMVGDPAGNLVSGTIEGFLSEEDAANATVNVGGKMPLDTLLCPEHMDGGGWWMHMNFTAVTTTWNG